ncbi:conserved within P. aerophilum [Pyrobaculum aerophilum str. IM2]|uniref:Conserved within P. aerophilum n=1 Tax=Pyrobaculum aerophilum (strain ATCC 51768 / DSM 7523 / JCM 9630 / CIP 104966 / NBRC 100827 / IM2) TaxID=178306 RepID=Q8ZYZ4_PYRAE|nr:conserved within P. aerophilum [Pyrobaculum aerophilum str. IM2]
MIIFIDDSGLKRPCNCLSLSAIAFPQRRGVSYLELGYHWRE